MRGRGSPDEARLEETPYPFHTQLIWRYLGIKWYILDSVRGGSYYCKGLKSEQWLSSPGTLTLTTGYKADILGLEHCFCLKLIGTGLDILILEHYLFVISFDDSSLAARRLHNVGAKCAVIHH